MDDFAIVSREPVLDTLYLPAINKPIRCPSCFGPTDSEVIDNPGGPEQAHVWCLWQGCGYEFIREAKTPDSTA